jgi:hypothetical protein
MQKKITHKNPAGKKSIVYLISDWQAAWEEGEVFASTNFIYLCIVYIYLLQKDLELDIARSFFFLFSFKNKLPP